MLKLYQYYVDKILSKFNYKLKKEDYEKIENEIKEGDFIDDYLNVNSQTCEDCYCCINCTNCSNCAKCENCIKCLWSKQCFNCIECSDCYLSNNCYKSNHCLKSEYLNECSGIINRKNLHFEHELVDYGIDIIYNIIVEFNVEIHQFDEHYNVDCNNCIDCKYCYKCTNCVKCFACSECINVEYSRYCTNCVKCYKCEHLNDCTNCAECYECINCNLCMSHECKDEHNTVITNSKCLICKMIYIINYKKCIYLDSHRYEEYTKYKYSICNKENLTNFIVYSSVNDINNEVKYLPESEIDKLVKTIHYNTEGKFIDVHKFIEQFEKMK